jgi:hypothetical protein
VALNPARASGGRPGCATGKGGRYVRHGRQGNERAPPHPHAGPPAHPTSHEHRAGPHFEGGRLAAGATDAEQAPPHSRPGQAADVAVDRDQPAADAEIITGECRRGVVAGIALHKHLAARHPGSQPVAGVTVDGQPASRHRRGCVAAGAASHRDLALLHAGAEPMHAGEIADALDPAIGGIAMNREQVAERTGTAVGQHLETGDGCGVEIE